MAGDIGASSPPAPTSYWETLSAGAGVRDVGERVRSRRRRSPEKASTIPTIAVVRISFSFITAPLDPSPGCSWSTTPNGRVQGRGRLLRHRPRSFSRLLGEVPLSMQSSHSAPAAIAAGAGGPQVGQRIVSAGADRGQMVYIGGRCPAMDADAAVSREHLLPDRSPPIYPEVAAAGTPGSGLPDSISRPQPRHDRATAIRAFAPALAAPRRRPGPSPRPVPLLPHCRSALLRPKPDGFEALGTQPERVKRTLEAQVILGPR